jgi:hypothetical protein
MLSGSLHKKGETSGPKRDQESKRETQRIKRTSSVSSAPCIAALKLLELSSAVLRNEEVLGLGLVHRPATLSLFVMFLSFSVRVLA